MTIWAFRIMCKPTDDAICTKQTILAIAALHWFS